MSKAERPQHGQWEVQDNGVCWNVKPLDKAAWAYVDEHIGRHRMRWGMLNVAYIRETNSPEMRTLADLLGLEMVCFPKHVTG